MSENYTQINEYQEKLLEAMQIVSSQLISSIPYDKTIVCTIVKDEEKGKGKYSVTNGEATFDAYSNDTNLKINDTVYVTIPEGNYDNQKIIQGKKTSDTEKPFVFTTPLDTMLNLTDNVLKDKPRLYEKGLIANNNYTTKINAEGIEELSGLTAHFTTLYELHDLEALNYVGYTRLGISADFMSWLPEAREGSYGLRITVQDKAQTTTTDDKDVKEITQVKTLLLDVSDMYGNPYNFETYYTQEKVFSIEELNTITDIKVEFYQIAGSFFDIEKNLIPLQDSTTKVDNVTNIITHSSEYGYNLFVDNIKIGLGYNVSEITDELIVPVINGSMTYSEYREKELNNKIINLRWVHQFEEGPLVVDPEEEFDKDKETARLKDCEIRWYRYSLGAAAADEYCGVYWVGQTVATNGTDGYILSDWDGLEKEIYQLDAEGNQIIDSETKQPILLEKRPDYGETQALTNVTFVPNTSYQTEQIKAIIFVDGVAIRGPVITFRNEQPKSGEEVSNFLNALEIECVDNTLGNYLIYNEAGDILNTADSQLERKLKCNFAETGTIAKSDLNLLYDKGDTITWKFPLNNSMIQIQRCGRTNIEYYQKIVEFTEDKPYVSNTYYIFKDNEYSLGVGDQILGETYFEKIVVDNTINISKVWTQVNEYPGSIEEWYNDDTIELKEIKDKNGKFQYYVFGQQKDEDTFIEYYKHNTLTSFNKYYEPWNIYKSTNQNYLILQGERTLYENPNVEGHTSILYPTYKITSKYSMYNMNNTIACTIRKDRMIYTTEKEFTFGTSGTMGSDKSIVIDFVGGQTAIIPGSGEAYQLEVKMYDENNKPEDLSGVKITWSWYTPGNDTLTLDALRYAGSELISDETPIKQWTRAVSGIGLSVIDLQFGDTELSLTDTKQIFIAEVTVGDEEAALKTYFPIPFKKSEEYSHIEGATSVIYLSNGLPEYFKGDYKLFSTSDNAIGEPIVEQVDSGELTWSLGFSKPDDWNDSTAEKRENYQALLPQVNSTGKGGLLPFNTYIQDIRNYCVITKALIGGVLTPVWKQPILVLKNNYPSRVINKWDGKTLDINKENGTILATAIAAGRKDTNNTFTGVMLGDWTNTSVDNSLATTGVYGFHQGDMSYAFMDNGKAFIGKDGAGRINFDCSTNEAIISSPVNMSINLTSGQINAKHFSLKAQANENQYVVLQTSTVGNGSLTTSALPFEIGKNFNVNWAGHVTAKSGDIGCWQLEQVVENADGTSTSGGRLIAKSVTGSQSSYWDRIYLDPVTNTISGGKLKASIFESTSTKPIKLGGAIDVYDPSKLVAITNPHTGNSENQVNYNTTSGGTNQGVFGGTLGFMTMDDGTETPDDFKPAGIGFKANGGAEIKATNQNVGMNIGSNYLFLTDYKTGEGNNQVHRSEFQVKVKGKTTQVAYTLKPKPEDNPDADDEYTITTSEVTTATSSMIFNGEGLKLGTGNDMQGGRIILVEGDDRHAGMGYADSYVALYPKGAYLRGKSVVELKANNSIVLSAGSSVLNLGQDNKKINIGVDGTKVNTIKGQKLILSTNVTNGRNIKIDSGGKVEINSGEKVEMLGKEQIEINSNDSISLYVGSRTVTVGADGKESVTRVKTGEIEIEQKKDSYNKLYNQILIQPYATIDYVGQTKIASSLTVTNSTSLGSTLTVSGLITANGGIQGGAKKNLTWQSGEINFHGATQKGIKAQFA